MEKNGNKSIILDVQSVKGIIKIETVGGKEDGKKCA